MPAPLSPTKLFRCQCGATLPLRSEHVGKRCRCGRCGKIMVVPHPGQRPKSPPKKNPPSQRKLGAMHGQQYGLWGVDQAPTSEQLEASHPEYFPVYCRNCDTLMHATAEQVGSKITCPDCGIRALVGKPPPKPPPKQALVPDGEEYQIDDAEPLPERPAYVPHKVREFTKFKKQEKLLRQESRERPSLPSVPLVQGVMRMLFRRPLPEAVIVLAFALALELWFIANARANVSGMALAIVLLSYATAALFGALSLMTVSAYWLTVLKESSEGSDRLHNPPGPIFLDWAGDCFYVIFAGAMSLAPGCLFWKFVPNLSVWTGSGAVAASWLVLFPVFLLSQLENGSPMEFFSPKLARTLLQRPGQWLLFYLEAILVVGGSAAAVIGLQLLSPWTLAASVLIASAASFLYFRLLGRIAWWLAESMSTSDDDLE